MKKKLMSLMLAITMIVTITGCVTKNTDTSNKEVTAEGYQKSAETNAEVYKKFIKLPEYLGMEAEVDKSILEVTDEDVDAYIKSVVESYATTENVTTGVTKNGDNIILDYSGKLDGVAFSGGTATDATYTVGSGKYISDLDKGLEGLTLGEKYEIPCKFPDDYVPTDMAGKDVIFEVTVTAIVKTIVPELNDAWVVANAEKLGTTETTVEGLKKTSREYLEATAQVEFNAAKFSSILMKIYDQVKPEKYPQKELDSLKATWKTNIETEYKNSAAIYNYLGIDSFDEFLVQEYGCDTDEEFDELAVEQAQNYLLEKMVITVIAIDNKIVVTADDIKKLGAEYAEYYGLESYDALLKEYGNLINAELGYGVLSEKVMDLLNEKAVEVPATKAAN